jgi:hypothetical protein
VELSEDGDEEFGDGEREEEGREFMFPGGLGPGAGVSGRSRADVKVVEKEESIDDCHVVETDSGDGGLSVFAVFGETSMLKRHKHNVDQDFGGVRKHIDSPFVRGVGASGGVGLKKREEVGGGVGDLDFGDGDFSRASLERGETVGKRRLGHFVKC